jgi:YD repeat-containing protein
VLVQVPGQADQNLSGSTYIVAQDASVFGAGWSLAGLDRLVAFTSDANGPAGQLRIFGSGGYRFYQGTTTFTSPTGDPGTLTLSGGTYTYTTPDGQSWTFNSSGYETKWSSADGKETLNYRYDGSNNLTGVTAIDGALATVSYNGNTVTFQAVNSRTTTLVLSGGTLSTVTNPDGGVHTFTYDTNKHVTQEQFGPNLQNNWAYTSAGVVGTYTWGAVSVGGVTNLSRTTYAPAATVGSGSLADGTVWGSSTDPTSHTSKEQLDSVGRTLQQIAPDGGITANTYSNGYVATVSDPLGRTTTFARDSAGYVTQTTLPDGSLLTYAYQSILPAAETGRIAI